MKYQNLFSGKSKKNITNMSSAELAKRVIMVKWTLSTETTLSNCFDFLLEKNLFKKGKIVPPPFL